MKTQEELAAAPASRNEFLDQVSKTMRNFRWQLFAIAVVVKLVLMAAFSSGFENELFLPFVRHFLTYFDNPWDYFNEHSVRGDEFPYQPLMLYIVALFCAPLQLLGSAWGWDNIVLRNVLFKLPTLIGDVSIAWLLIKMFPNKTRQVFWLYFCSPIIVYACYLHSQLDLIPTAFLFASLYCLRKASWLPAAFLFGLSLSTKLHVLAAFPLFAIYLFRNQSLSTSLYFGAVSLGAYLFFAHPYLVSTGFQQMVMANPKQSRIFEVFAQVGDLKIYLPIFATFIAYGRFAMYPKINADLLDAFLTLVFSVFVLLILPAPGWYVWIAPFLSLFMIKYFRKNRQLLAPLFWVNGFYLLYFIVFHHSDHTDLLFWNQPVVFPPMTGRLQSFVFTLLEAGLLSVIVLCYRAGIRSNTIYKRDHALVIGIGGDSGTGKSTLLGDTKQLLRNRVVEVEGDADHKWTRSDEHWQTFTHLDPKANLLHRQADTILSLKRGRTVQRAEYDHGTGQFTSPKIVHSNDFIVLSGLHTFYLPKMRKIVDLKIFMDPDRAVQSRWKMRRDTSERSYSQSQVIRQMEKRQPDVDRFIAPQKDFADMIISYFQETDSAGEVDGPDSSLRLKISLSSSIHLEDLVQALSGAGVLFNWDYNEDLSKQDIILARPVPTALLQRLANELVPNLDELVETNIEWTDGYRGFVQLIVLLAVSDLMREKEDSDAI